MLAVDWRSMPAKKEDVIFRPSGRKIGVVLKNADNADERGQR